MSCCDKILEAAGSATGCACPSAGYCARHRCEKHEHWHNLCRTRPDYFELWERGAGPCLDVQSAPPGGLGDTLAWLIELVTFRRVKPCGGCNSRKAKLNRWFPYWWRK